MANPVTKLLQKNRFIRSLMSLDGNAKWVVLCEPFWAITSALYSAYAVQYRKEVIGLNNENLGFLLGTLATISLVSQFVCSFVGGVIIDKYGRRRIYLISDLLSAGFSMLLLALAKNFWWFAASMFFAGGWQIATNAWSGITTEDTDPKKIPIAFSGMSVMQLAATFLTPIAILLVNRFGVVNAMHGVYFFAAASQSLKSILMYLKTKETQQGIQRMEETRDVPFLKMFADYGRIFKLIFATPVTRLLLMLVLTLNINNVIINTFFYDFATERLGLPAASLGYIPMIRAVVCLLFMFTAQSYVNERSHKVVLSVGLLLYVAAFASPILFQNFSWVGVVLYIFFEAIANAFIYPRKESLLFLYIDKKERSRVYGLLHVLALAVSSPFGTIMGAMSDVNRLLPFLFAIAVSIGCSVLIVLSKAESKSKNTAAGQ